MNKINSFLARVGVGRDITLVFVVVLVIFMMILPLPAFIMDTLITFSMSLSIIVMLVALRIQTPLEFMTFPSILLVSTLFRLAISISTTRLILLEGSAGDIIATFGEVVIGGNLVVGLVIFLIITVVQFLVITKGADRVAEVTARFTLDGLPGKQMSIDADLRAGNLTQKQARDRRSDLELETKLFGSMDGAMKFVKGDATAGLVITAINLIGGIMIGMTQKGMSFGEAGTLYSTMTIGDGLVAQIPALLTSISAGTIVTRVAGEGSSDLSTDMSIELSNNNRTLQICGIVVVLFGFIPGFPTVIFAFVGGAIGLLGYLNSRRIRLAATEKTDTWTLLEKKHSQFVKEECEAENLTPSLTIMFPKSIRQFDVNEFGYLFDELQTRLTDKYGIPFGIWNFLIDEDEEARYQIYIKGKCVDVADLELDRVFIRGNSIYMQLLEFGITTEFKDEDGCMVSKDEVGKLQELKIEYHDGQAIFFRRLENMVERNLPKFIMIEEVRRLLEKVGKNNQALSDLLGESVPKERLAYILKKVVQEGVSIASIDQIFETILYWAPKEENSLVVADKVRETIGAEIVEKYELGGLLPVTIIAPSLEGVLRDSLRVVGSESFMVLDTDVSDHLFEHLDNVFQPPFKSSQDPVISVQSDIRQGLQSVLRERGYELPVLSYQEIPHDVTLYPVAFIQPPAVLPEQSE